MNENNGLEFLHSPGDLQRKKYEALKLTWAWRTAAADYLV